MRTIEMDFKTRVKLTGSGREIGGILGVFNGPLGKARALAKVFDEVRFSEDEISQIRVKTIGPGQFYCEPPELIPGVPDMEWGKKTIVIEDFQALMLREELANFPLYGIADTRRGSWLEKLEQQLPPLAGSAV